jgi:tetratricopeptide (TPR) repeat protein
MSDAKYNIDAQNSNIHVIGDNTTYINLDQVPKPIGFPQNIPRSNTDKFVGREKELVDIHNHLQQNNSAVISAVQGMGGIGKTELATQYSLLHLQLNSYPAGICWLRARDENVGLQIIQFCHTSLGLKPPDDINDLLEQVRWCWQRWTQGNTLVVFDDVQNYREIQPYLPPQASQFKVLITTRLKLDLPGSLSLEVLSESGAMELLAQLIGSDKLNLELDKAKELCQRLGNLPLALQLVGRYVKKCQIPLAEILTRLEEKGLGDPALNLEKDERFQTLSLERGVKAAFELSWEEISPAAQELGCLLSLFALSPIPWSLVEQSFKPRKLRWWESLLEMNRRIRILEGRKLRRTNQNLEDIKESKVELIYLHLLQGEDSYQLHQLIREFLKTKQKKLTGAKEQKSHFCQAMVKVAQAIPNSPTQHDIKSVKDAIPHLAGIAENLIDAVSDEDLYWPFVGIGRYYEGQGLYKLAEPWFEQCVSLLETRLGEEHPDVATSYNNLAELYRVQGRYSEAEPLYQKALALWQKLLGEDHPSVATSYNNLAALYDSQGRYREAEPLYQKALALLQKLLGEDHPSVATSYNNLAELYRVQGRYSEAEPLYQQALALKQRLLGEDHPSVATSYNNLALLYDSQGRYSEAEPLYQKALALLQKLLGEEHPDVATSYNNLALLYYSQGRYSEAEPLYQQALALSKKLLGEDHPYVATSYNNLALLYDSQGRYSEAEPLYQKALALRQKLLGEDHPDVATSYNNLAVLYDSQGRYSEAEPLYQQALDIATRTLGENHPNTITIRESLELLRNQLS